MSREMGCSQRFSCVVDGVEYEVVEREVPFREGVELSCMIDGEELRVSDRGLGRHEALRLLEVEIKRYICNEIQ